MTYENFRDSPVVKEFLEDPEDFYRQFKILHLLDILTIDELAGLVNEIDKPGLEREVQYHHHNRERLKALVSPIIKDNLKKRLPQQ